MADEREVTDEDVAAIPPEPLREPGTGDDGEPMPPQAAAAYAAFDRDAEQADLDLAAADDRRGLRRPPPLRMEGDKPPERLICVIMVPIVIPKLTPIMFAISEGFPDSFCRGDDNGNMLIYERD